jgi:3-isopropylmalate dehydratase small subunit
MVLRGKVHKFGDHVDTDVIIPAPYLVTTDAAELGQHCMEPVDPDFAGKVKKGDIIVAGENFGCGSSREHAPLAIRGAGLSCVIAASFARIFFRNAVNIGLPLVTCPEAAREAQPGDELEVDLASGAITNITRKKRYQAQPYPESVRRIIEAGGIIAYARQRLTTTK